MRLDSFFFGGRGLGASGGSGFAMSRLQSFESVSCLGSGGEGFRV